MTDVKGFFYPRTASGRSSLIPSPPWFYSGDLLTVEYRTDPARVAELLPAPLELAEEDPGAVALIWADWQSCSTSREELLDPVRSQYKEAFVVVRCSYQGQTYSRCVFIWVDKDFAIGRGVHQGYPKKLGTMWQTRPHPFAHGRPADRGRRHLRRHPGRGRPAAGRGRADAAGGVRRQRLRQLPPDGPPPGLPRHRRRRPGRVRGADLLRRQRVRGADRRGSGDADLRLFESPTEELDRLRVDEIIGGYYRQVGVVWNGGALAGDAHRT